MGWAIAPAIAQSLAQVLMTDIPGFAWVDNLYTWGKSAITELKQRLADVQLDYNTEDPDHILGLRSSPNGYTLWDTEKLPLELKNPSTAREWLHLYGMLMWHHFVKRQPLCFFPQAMSALSRICKTAAFFGWDEILTLSQDQLHELNAWLLEVRKNDIAEYPPDVKVPDCLIFSDASDLRGAYIIFTKENKLLSSYQYFFTETEICWPIYLKELKMALLSVQDAFRHGYTAPRLFTDNTPVMFTLARWLSTNFMANRLMHTFLSQGQNKDFHHLNVFYIPSDLNIVDAFSRDATIPTSLSSLQQYIQFHLSWKLKQESLVPIGGYAYKEE
jgi:hypothetical protein